MKLDVENLYDRRADHRWERVSVGDIFERMTWSQPDKLALVAAPCAVRDPQFARVTYRQADQAANAIAHGLLAHGLVRGARVALFCDNSIEAFLVKIACAKAGLVAMPLNTMMAADMLEHSLRQVGAAAAIIDAEAWPRAKGPLTAVGLPVLATIVTPEGDSAGLPSLAQLMHGQPATEPEVRIHGDDIWEILMTSGTTAMPKAVMISHTCTYLAGLNQASAYSRGVPVESDYRVCSFLPMIYHVGDQIFPMSALLSGGSVVLGRTPTPANLCAAIDRERPSAYFVGSPQFLADLVRTAEASDPVPDLGSLRVVIYGWGAVDPAVRERLKRLSPQASLVGIFGQTECIALHRFPVEQYSEVYQQTAPATNVVGLPTPLLASTVMDEEGRSLHGQPGVRGEVVYRSPIITAGYFRDEPATRAAFRHGWFHSGDLCEFRDDGLRVMVDRYKDVVKSGGENVSSLRVESVIAQFPGVARVAVVGLPDPRWGERVTAVVVPRPGETIDETALIAFCRERLAGFETPKRVVLMDDLPATVGGKVLKYKLREMLATR
ncbi:class I adenylate-forming enzyme family protein [uncultured Nevskia sp.]|uniref:class I adenylate-forming enzyme family protein n=1 Tax=uncultured Nevskia sp. TaxID=228950 RepID=UPI0025F47953|nr:AMP-binding protein [uncultured Nevskia sp.]